jgi:hypothetical protein
MGSSWRCVSGDTTSAASRCVGWCVWGRTVHARSLPCDPQVRAASRAGTVDWGNGAQDSVNTVEQVRRWPGCTCAFGLGDRNAVLPFLVLGGMRGGAARTGGPCIVPRVVPRVVRQVWYANLGSGDVAIAVSAPSVFARAARQRYALVVQVRVCMTRGRVRLRVGVCACQYACTSWTRLRQALSGIERSGPQAPHALHACAPVHRHSTYGYSHPKVLWSPTALSSS